MTAGERLTKAALEWAEIDLELAEAQRAAKSAEFRAAWHEEHGTAAKPRG